jgi:hypothetical protein
MITHVAIYAADRTVYALLSPHRHADLFAEFPQLRTVTAGGLLVTREGQTQGFLRDAGKSRAIIALPGTPAHRLFLSRHEALAHVQECGQPLTGSPGGVHAGQLYSEGVW